MRNTIITLCLLASWQLQATDIKQGCYGFDITSPTTVSLTSVAIGNYDPYTGYQTRDTAKLVVPETIEFQGHRLQVTAIGRSAFSLARPDTVVLPATIREIGDYAFQNSTIRHINLPDGLRKLGDGCFYQCKLEHVTLPGQLESIGWQAFSFCPLKELHLPEALETISREAFSQCKELTELDVPGSVKTIGNGAFSWCEKLERITTHGDITTISYDSFNGCKKLTTVEWGGTVKELGGFAFCSSLKSFTIPEGTQTIFSGAFNECTSLQELVIPSSVSSIGQSVFNGCTSLKEIAIPAGVRSVQSGTFNGCTSLETLTLGENIENISGEAFEGCSSLKCFRVRSQKPCSYGVASFSQSILDIFNSAELYIPTGSKAAYAVADFWKNFRSVSEYDPGTCYNAILLTVKEGGSVSCNGQLFGEGESTLLVPAGQAVSFAIMPDEDHAFSSAEQRYEYGIDYLTDNVSDNRLTIATIKPHSNVWVFFEAAKVNIDVLQNEQGRVRLTVSKNQRYACRIIEEEGWRVNSITYNGEDITRKAGVGNYIQTPVVREDAVIRIAFEKGETGIRQTGQEDGLKVLGDDNGITLQQTQAGERIDVFLADGRLVRSIKADGNSQHIGLRPGAVYLVKTKTKTIKIRL